MGTMLVTSQLVHHTEYLLLYASIIRVGLRGIHSTQASFVIPTLKALRDTWGFGFMGLGLWAKGLV